MKPLSYTQISLYQTCPLRYKRQYIDGLKPRDKGYFSFGTTMHACAEYFFRVNVPPPPSLEELLQFYEANWLSEGYQSTEEEASYRAYGREILARFWEIHQADFKIPLAVERMFYIDIEGIKLRGFIDRVDKLESGGLAITDYKTSRELFTTEYIAQDLQLTLYQLAAEQLWRLPVERLTLYHLRSNTPCSCPPRDEAHLEEARCLVTEVAAKISADIFPATENEFCPCDFAEHCPYYRQKYAGIEAQTRALDILRGMTIEEAVARYVALQSQFKELELEFNEIKQIVTDFCQSESLNRLYGREHAITYRLVERTGFSEDDIRAILEPAGLWQRALGFDPSRVKKLLDDEEISRDIRDRLKERQRVISAYPRLTVARTDEEK